MVIGRPQDENFRFIPEDLYVEHRDYYNDVLIEIEYDIVNKITNNDAVFIVFSEKV